jgi:hypothetical protein
VDGKGTGLLQARKFTTVTDTERVVLGALVKRPRNLEASNPQSG